MDSAEYVEKVATEEDARLDERTRDLVTGAWDRANGEVLFSETTVEGVEEAGPMTFSLVRFVVSLNHPGLDLDWVADKAVEYTGE